MFQRIGKKNKGKLILTISHNYITHSQLIYFNWTFNLKIYILYIPNKLKQ